MFNKDDILARLQNGDSVDEIAKEMTDALNEAKTEYDEAEVKRQAELEAARKQAEADARAHQEKEELALNIIEKIVAYLEYNEYQDMADRLTNFAITDMGKIVDAFDATIELAEMTEKLKVLEYGSLFNPVVVKNLPKPVQKAVKPTPDDIISEFLKTL